MKRWLIAVAVLFGLAAPAAAELSSAAGQVTRPAAEIAAFARQVEESLAQRGAQVALVARMGRDPATMPPGLSYTHAAFWVYSDIRTSAGQIQPGYAVFNLYQEDRNPARSYLRQDFAADFFADVFAMKAAVVVPRRDLQARLLGVILSPRYVRLHNPNYALAANPLDSRYQNCTGFMLDVVMAALYDTDAPERLMASKRAYFLPQPLEVGGMQRLLASMFMSGMKTDDHGATISTATFQSLSRFLDTYRLADETFYLDGER